MNTVACGKWKKWVNGASVHARNILGATQISAEHENNSMVIQVVTLSCNKLGALRPVGRQLVALVASDLSSINSLANCAALKALKALQDQGQQ